MAGGNGGNAYVNFYRDDGTLIDSFTLGSLPLIASYGFVRDGGVQDIRGVSIWNDDPTGFGLSAIRSDVAAVPEPTTWAMMLLGFGAIGSAMRRRTRKHSSCSLLSSQRLSVLAGAFLVTPRPFVRLSVARAG